jgi:hypothetical protein
VHQMRLVHGATRGRTARAAGGASADQPRGSGPAGRRHRRSLPPEGPAAAPPRPAGHHVRDAEDAPSRRASRAPAVDRPSARRLPPAVSLPAAAPARLAPPPGPGRPPGGPTAAVPDPSRRPPTSPGAGPRHRRRHCRPRCPGRRLAPAPGRVGRVRSRPLAAATRGRRAHHGDGPARPHVPVARRLARPAPAPAGRLAAHRAAPRRRRAAGLGPALGRVVEPLDGRPAQAPARPLNPDRSCEIGPLRHQLAPGRPLGWTDTQLDASE